MRLTKLFLFIALFLGSCTTPTTPTLVPTATFTLTPQPTATQTPARTPTITPVPTQVGGSSGRIAFMYIKREFNEAFPDLPGEMNVFLANIDGSNQTPMTHGLEGYNFLEGVSPDGTKLLIASASDYGLVSNQRSTLYLVDLKSPNSNPIEIAKNCAALHYKNIIAKWINNTQIVYIGSGESGFGIHIYDINSADQNNIYTYNNDGEGRKPSGILAISKEQVYWYTWITTNIGGNMYNLKNYIWSSRFDGTESKPFELNGKQMFEGGAYGVEVSFSPSGEKVAWTEPATPTFHHQYLHIASVSDLNNPYTFSPITGDLSMQWLPDGTKILVNDRGSTSEFFGYPETRKSDLFGIYEVSTTADLKVRPFHLPKENEEKTFLYDISPDGHQVLYSRHKKNADGNSVTQLYLLDLENLTFTEVSNINFYWEFALGGVYWIP